MVEILRITHRVGMLVVNRFVDRAAHELQGAGRGPGVGIHAVRVRVAVMVVRTGARNRLDATAQVDDSRPFGELVEQGGLKGDQPRREDPLRLIQGDVLLGRKLEILGRSPRRHKHLDRKILLRDRLHERTQRRDRDIDRRLGVLRRWGSATHRQEECGYIYKVSFHAAKIQNFV